MNRPNTCMAECMNTWRFEHATIRTRVLAWMLSWVAGQDWVVHACSLLQAGIPKIPGLASQLSRRRKMSEWPYGRGELKLRRRGTEETYLKPPSDSMQRAGDAPCTVRVAVRGHGGARSQRVQARADVRGHASAHCIGFHERRRGEVRDGVCNADSTSACSIRNGMRVGVATYGVCCSMRFVCAVLVHALEEGGSEGARWRTEPAGAEGRAGRQQVALRSRDIGVRALSGPVRVPSVAWEGAGTASAKSKRACVSARERGGCRVCLLLALGRCIRLRPGVTVKHCIVYTARQYGCFICV